MIYFSERGPRGRQEGGQGRGRKERRRQGGRGEGGKKEGKRKQQIICNKYDMLLLWGSGAI